MASIRIIIIIFLLSTFTYPQPSPISCRTIDTGIKEYIFTLEFADSLNGWALSASNNHYGIHKTIDGGERWTRQILPIDTVSLYKICVVDKFTCYVVGDKGTILATKDGGLTWIIQRGNVNNEILMGIRFIKETGWISGFIDSGGIKEGFLLKTTDGGGSWSKIYSQHDGILFYELYFYDNLNGLIVGSLGRDITDFSNIYSTNDGGKSLKLISSDTHVFLQNIYPVGQDTIWGAGFGFSTSFDRGSTWSGYNFFKVTDSTFSNAIRFDDLLPLDGKRGWAVFSYFTNRTVKHWLWYTENSGKLWYFITMPDNFEPTTIAGVNNYIYLGGTNGNIITTRLKPVHVEGFAGIYPQSCELYHNFPNPFNPQTSIKYNLAENTFVTLYVTDVQGRIIKNLVHDTMSKGNHNIVWDGSDNRNVSVSSGVYFIILTENGKVHSRKAILCK